MSKSFGARVAQNGRLVLPETVCDALGLPEGGIVVFSVEGSEVKLTSIRQSIGRAQQLYRQFAVQDRSVDAFLADRKAEAARENQSRS